MSQEDPLDVAAWLCEVSSLPDAPDSESPVTPTKATRKRKRVRDHSELPQRRSPYHHRLTGTALAELTLNMMNTPSPSVQKRNKKTRTIMTAQTDATKPSYEAASRPLTATPSSSSSAKQTHNEHNVRTASAEQGMYFEDEESYKEYSEFQGHIENMVLGARGSAIRVESLKKIRTWRVENATANEKTYFARAVPLILKDARGATETRKRTFEDEIKREAISFESDALDHREDCLFVKNILPLRTTYDKAAKEGVTTPKPDFVYGLKCPRHPEPDEPRLSQETKALIGVAPELRHAFFSVDNKGSQHSIEAAENQAMRSGATMVAARRALNRKAKGNLEPAMLEGDAEATNAIAADTATVTRAAASDASVTAADATVNTIAPGPQANDFNREDFGVDTSSFAFTCSWVPQMANLHVHWCERRPNGSEIYHMNLLRGYLMSRDADVADFRNDVHNILDWGIAPKRKDMLKELETEIAKNESRGG